MSYTYTQNKLIKIIVGVTIIYCVLMAAAIAWTLYGPIPGIGFEAVVEINEKSGTRLRHNRYFLSPYFSNASLAIPVRNLPAQLARNGMRVVCSYRTVERDKFRNAVLDGADCKAIGDSYQQSNSMISQDTAIDQVRFLPEVQAFVAAVEAAHKDLRRVNYRVEDELRDGFYVVVVSESDEEKDTPWKLFHVKVDGSEILVENSVTGELEPYIN